MIDIPTDLSNYALFVLIVGAVQPVVFNFLINSKWTSRVKALAALGYSAVTGALTAYFADAFNGLGIVTTILLVAVISITTYRGFWKDVTPKLQEKTDLPK